MKVVNLNDNRAANVRANMECDFEASLYRENEVLHFTYACRKIFTCVAPIVSERVQALLAIQPFYLTLVRA